MPYSSIRETPYQTIIIPYPNFVPIHQVILLKNSNEWNLSPTKRRILKKNRKEKGARIEKKKGGTSFEKLHVSKGEKKRKRKRDLQAAGRDSIEIK
jgi:hypothetical protein